MMDITAPLEQIDETIHGRIRLGILAYLSTAGSADFLTVQTVTRTTKGNLSSHIARLETAGYVRVEKTFVDRKTRTILHMTQEGEHAFAAYLANLRTLLNQLPDKV